MRLVQLKTNNGICAPCPKCGNNTEFRAYSKQVCEDGCEVWVECICGYDPTSDRTGYRYEDIMGGIDYGTVMMAIECWNYAIND